MAKHDKKAKEKVLDELEEWALKQMAGDMGKKKKKDDDEDEKEAHGLTIVIGG